MVEVYVKQNGTLLGPFRDVLAAKAEVLKNLGVITYKVV